MAAVKEDMQYAVARERRDEMTMECVAVNLAIALEVDLEGKLKSRQKSV